MPKVSAGQLQIGPGAGCQCPAFRPGKPKPETVFKAMIKAADVKVTDLGLDDYGNRCFLAWTNPKSKYSVVYSPTSAGGFCKHVAAVAQFLVGSWLLSGYQEVQERNEEWTKKEKEYKKQIRSLTRKIPASSI